MAAYAALVSLTHILNQILQPPPRIQIIIVREQIEFLLQKANFLLDFLENCSGRRRKEIEDLERRITDAAYAAEDIIESNVMSQIFAAYAIQRKKSSILLHQGIQTVTEKFLSIEKELEKIKDKKGMENLQPKNESSKPLPSGKNTMVGFREHLIGIMGALTTNESNRQIIPIVGMGGIGKTTLAANVYDDPFIVEYFHIRAWVTVSKEYTLRELLLVLLHQIKKGSADIDKKESVNLAKFTAKMRKTRDDELGELLHKELFERKYLIVIDDIWDIEPWDKVRKFLPGNNSGSRILVTTRLSNLAVDFGSCSPYEMNFLDGEQSWDLLREKVFAKEDCPAELEKIGKSIAKRCGGLPLALVVIGGLLAKSKRTREHWEYVEGDVISAANYEDDEQCMKILSLSYSHLPEYLKPCFLYLALFPEDFEIHVARLIRLWVAEGLVRPTKDKSLEEVADEYIKDLIDRNLILIRKRGSSGNAKTCSIHDLLRDHCSREAHKDKFLRIAKLDNLDISPYLESERRLSIHYSTSEEKVCKTSLRSATLNRSLLSYFEWTSGMVARSFSLLRVLDVVDRYSTNEILQLTNLRYAACSIDLDFESTFSSISLLWNLKTLVLDGSITLPAEIWQMPQLRHVKIQQVYLQDPPDAQIDEQDIIILENLQILSRVGSFKCTEQVIKRIPNVKKLGICYGSINGYRRHCLRNLIRLHKLESLRINDYSILQGNIAFPSSLKKLRLEFCQISWEDMSIVGSLPNLEVLKLIFTTQGHEWNPIEGEFCRLKFLLIKENWWLTSWRADNTHFPCLERLILRCRRLDEIPMSFAEIQTLQVIEMHGSRDSLLQSAKAISAERESLGYEVLQVLSYP